MRSSHALLILLFLFVRAIPSACFVRKLPPFIYFEFFGRNPPISQAPLWNLMRQPSFPSFPYCSNDAYQADSELPGTFEQEVDIIVTSFCLVSRF